MTHEATAAEILVERGWIREGDLLRPPAMSFAGHVHTAACTIESCGAGASFSCGPTCIRVMRKTGGREECRGHRLPPKAKLVEYSLRQRGIRESAPRGTPLEEGTGGNQ